MRRWLTLLLLSGATARAAEQPPPPAPNAASALPESVALPRVSAREPSAEPDAIKVRLNGEYELRQSFLTPLPLAPIAGEADSLQQNARLYHWLRLRGLQLFGEHWVLRQELDFPRGLIYAKEPGAIPNSGSDFARQQPLGIHPRVLRLTLRGQLGEVSLGHTTVQHGLGLVDADGDQPRFFGASQRPATFERLELLSGTPDSKLRVGAAADTLFDDLSVGLAHGDRLVRLGLSARFAPRHDLHFDVLIRYETLGRRDERGGAQTILFDSTGGVRRKIPGRDGEVFLEYEAAYRVGDVQEQTDYALSDQQSLSELAAAARVGIALHRTEELQRFASFVASFEWGIASGDADPTDDELHRFVMNPNHSVGLILFSEVLRYKSSRAEALLDQSRSQQAFPSARLERLATAGGVAGAAYVNPVLLVRPSQDLTLKLGGVVASATAPVVDPSSVQSGNRRNFDGGSVHGRSLGTELDWGAELAVPLEPPMGLRLSVEGAVAFPGAAFADANGIPLGTQALTTAGLGLTF